MSLWFTRTTINLIIPLTMIIIGYSYVTNPPKNINRSSGYRTSMSMKNQFTWKLAHKYLGRLWLRGGLIILCILILLLYIIAEKPDGTFVYINRSFFILELIYMFITLISTEMKLRKNFNKNKHTKRR